MGPEVAAAITAVSALVSAGAGFYAAHQQSEAADEAGEIAERNAERAEAEAEESARRLQRQQDANQSLARARSAASGVVGGSIDDYLSGMEAEDARQLDWMRKSGKSQSDIIRAEGDLAVDRGKSAAWSTAIGATTDFLGAGGEFAAGFKKNEDDEWNWVG